MNQTAMQEVANTAPGLIEPGLLVEVQDITGHWQGLCIATSINASGVGAVIQRIDEVEV